MPRKAKPFLHQGHYYTTRGGVWLKLCPAADGPERAAAILAAIPARIAPDATRRAVAPGDLEPGSTADRPASAKPEARFSGTRLEFAVSQYLAHCRRYYILPTGVVSREVMSIEVALRYLLAAAGNVAPAELSRMHLILARNRMTAACNRQTVNTHVGRIKRAVRWMAENGLVPDTAAASMSLLSPLPPFRSGLREQRHVAAAPLADVLTVVERIREPWASIIRLQWFTGLRPGEACGLTTAQVLFDRYGDGGEFHFGFAHKSGWRGKKKVVQFGQQAALILRPFVFAAEASGREALFTIVGRGVKAKTEGRAVSANCYQAAVRLTCRRLGVAPWHPNQLRHSYATRVRAALGLEAAQTALGHSRADVTQIYAERDNEKAARAARLLG